MAVMFLVRYVEYTLSKISKPKTSSWRNFKHAVLYPHRGDIQIAYRPQNTHERITHRLKIARGHLDKVIKMMDEDAYCIDVITQTSAVKRALSGVEDALMESHLGTCVVHQMKKGKEGTAVKEILKVYGLKRA